jgi:hypothetical protein
MAIIAILTVFGIGVFGGASLQDNQDILEKNVETIEENK